MVDWSKYPEKIVRKFALGLCKYHQRLSIGRGNIVNDNFGRAQELMSAFLLKSGRGMPGSLPEWFSLLSKPFTSTEHWPQEFAFVGDVALWEGNMFLGRPSDFCQLQAKGEKPKCPDCGSNWFEIAGKCVSDLRCVDCGLRYDYEG